MDQQQIGTIVLSAVISFDLYHGFSAAFKDGNRNNVVIRERIPELT